MNENLTKAREEYLKKLKAGEVSIKNPKDRWSENKKSLRASIDAFCFECIGESIPEIRECTAKNCPLYVVRPYQK